MLFLHIYAFCEGDCQGWLHRKCVCMTKKLYVALGQSDEPYLCPHCAFAQYEQEIDSLKDQVKSLSEELTLLNMQQSKSNNLRDNTFPDSVNALHSETNQSVNPDNDQQSSTQIPTVSNTGLSKPPNGILPGDRKFNVIIFGLKECPKGTPRPDRYKSDLNESISIMTKVNTDINPHSIRDCLRLGKYNTQAKRPRPLLIKLNRVVDASNLLYNKDRTPVGITIKPDLSCEDRQSESLLLSERWALIQSGVDRKDIKIRSSSIYVKVKNMALWIALG